MGLLLQCVTIIDRISVMEAIMAKTVEIPVSWFLCMLIISTILLMMGWIKLVVIINYFMIIYYGHLLNYSFFGNEVGSTSSGSVLILAVFVVINILLAAVCLYYHKE